MKNKGFTLIELLAVILIMAVILALVFPNVAKILVKNEETGGGALEKILVSNLELYNTDKKEEYWNDDRSIGKCLKVDIDEIININPGLDMGECLLKDKEGLVIKRISAKRYKYYVNIVCGKDLQGVKYWVQTNEQKYIYYESKNSFECTEYIN